MMRRWILALSLLVTLSLTPLWAQLRPGTFTQIQTTSTTVNSVLVGCALNSTTCTGGIKAGQISLARGLAIGGATISDAGIVIADDVPADTSFALYNDSGTLKWNGVALAAGSSVSGTQHQIAVFTGATSIGNSIMAQNAGATIVTLTGTMNATTAYQLNGTNINTTGTLTNVAYKAQDNAFTVAQTMAEGLIVPSLVPGATTNAFYNSSGRLTFGTTTLAYVTDKLSVFATTTSLELNGVISDNTGSGALVFATSPTFVTPTLGVATATTLDTGQGANELYDMDQNVLTTSSPTFSKIFINGTNTSSTFKSPLFLQNDAGTTAAGEGIGFWMQLAPSSGGNCNTANPVANDFVAYYGCMESNADRSTAGGSAGLYGANYVLTATAGNNNTLVGIEVDIQNLSGDGTSVPAAWATNGKVGVGAVLATNGSTDGDGSAAFSGTVNGSDLNDLWKYGAEMSGVRTASFYARKTTNLGDISPTNAFYGDVDSTNFLHTVGTHTKILESPNFDIYGSVGGRASLIGTEPVFDFYESDAAVDAKYWRFSSGATAFVLQSVNDAYSVATSLLSINRSTGALTATGSLTERSRSVAVGEWANRTYSAGDYTASDGTWTVASGDVTTNRYTLVGKTVTWQFVIVTSSVSSTPASLRVAIPSGLTEAAGITRSGVCNADGLDTNSTTAAWTISGAGYAALTSLGGTWVTSTNTTSVSCTIVFEIA